MSLRPSERIRRRILLTLGVSPLIGCGPAPIDSEGGVTTDPSGEAGEGQTEDGTDEGTATSTSSTTTFTTTGESGESETETVETGETETGETEDSGEDSGVIPDLPPELVCTATQMDSWDEVLETYPDCNIDPAAPVPNTPCPSNPALACVEPPPGQACEDLCIDGDCPPDWSMCDGLQHFEFGEVICGPYEVEGACCSLRAVAITGELCGIGRPFIVGGQSRTAAVELGSLQSPPVSDLRVAARWVEFALAEHASVASFARFGRQLLELGAPPELLRACLRAGADEARHAQTMAANAERHAGRSLSFGPLAIPREAPRSLAEIVDAAVVEGCIGETLSALEVAQLAELVVDPELARSLRAIAEDELRHAELAWRFVAWALAREPDLGPRVVALLDACPLPDFGDDESVDDEASLAGQGWQRASARRHAWETGRRAIIEPCARALLG